MKRVLLALCCAGGLSACGGGSSSSTGDAGVPDAAVEVWLEQDQRGEAPLGRVAIMPAAGTRGAFTLLSANVGNIDFIHCGGAIYKLCRQAAEDAVARRIRELSPDVVLLQEVLPPSVCATLQDIPDWHACHPSRTAAEPEQVRRLLGVEYTIACDGRRGFECVAVHRRAGSVEGCADGALCRGGARVTDAVDGCDDGFTVTAVTATVRGTRVDLFSGHPQSGNQVANQRCRKDTLQQVLPEGAPLRSTANVALLAGDLNMDVWRTTSANPDVVLWNAHVSSSREDASRPWAMHSGVLEHDPPYWSAWIARVTWDHVASVGLWGHCQTLGAAPGLAPLDRFEGSQDVEMLDHLALFCALSLPSGP